MPKMRPSNESTPPYHLYLSLLSPAMVVVSAVLVAGPGRQSAPKRSCEECRRCDRPMKARLQSTCLHRSRVQQWSSCRRCWSLGRQSAPKRSCEECRRCVRPTKARLHTTNCFQHRSNSVVLPLLLQHDQQIGRCRRHCDTGGIPIPKSLKKSFEMVFSCRPARNS